MLVVGDSSLARSVVALVVTYNELQGYEYYNNSRNRSSEVQRRGGGRWMGVKWKEVKPERQLDLQYRERAEYTQGDTSS